MRNSNKKNKIIIFEQPSHKEVVRIINSLSNCLENSNKRFYLDHNMCVMIRRRTFDHVCFSISRLFILYSYFSF